MNSERKIRINWGHFWDMYKIPAKTLSIIIILTVMAGIYPLISNHALPVLAQTSTDPWSEPANLSHSGVATTPTVLVDALGTVHAIWEDEFAGTMYTRRVDGACLAVTGPW